MEKEKKRWYLQQNTALAVLFLKVRAVTPREGQAAQQTPPTSKR